jgi:glycosyltransferase involved in cell wall biosynthesis
VIDATILIPTHAHAELLPYALRSALAQDGVEIEVFVVGDGVADDTRRKLAPFLDDSRVTFFDNPKGERHGEAHRHAALQHARGKIVCYLSDDDLLLPDHVAELIGPLAGADFAHSAPVTVDVDGSLLYWPIDLSRPEYQAMLSQGRWNAIGLTGASHTLSAYRRLSQGWRPAPPDIWTDLHMWLEFVSLADFRGVTGTRLTALHFPSIYRGNMSAIQRRDELAHWWTRLRQPGFTAEIDRELTAAVRRAAATYRAYAHSLELQAAGNEEAVLALTRQVQELRATRTWRAREVLLRLRLARALLARSPGGR